MQLVNLLSHAIAAGHYRAGDQLPTEAELCAAYDVSPMTVRRAIGVLLDRGAVSTTRGRGTFVDPLRWPATFELSAFRDLLADSRVEAKVLEARVVPAGARAAANLAVPEGTRIISIRRLLARGAEPLSTTASRWSTIRRRPPSSPSRRHCPARSFRGRRRGRPQARRLDIRFGPDRG